jgi:L-iditol 2-dehydrogenase
MEQKIVCDKNLKLSLETLEDQPTALLENEVLIKPLSIGICGSDIHQFEKRTESFCLGHEWVGEVISAGAQSQFKASDLITSPAKIFCGECHFCQTRETNLCEKGILIGGDDKSLLRTWVIFETRHLLRLPKMKIEALALLEVAAIADQAIRKLQSLEKKKDKLLIFGAGAVGLLTALSAKRQGYQVLLVEKEGFRVKVGLSLAIETMPLAMFISDTDFRHSFSTIIDCTGDSRGQKGAMSLLPFYASVNSSIIFVGIYNNTHEFQQSLYQRLSSKISWVSGASKKNFEESIEFWKEDIELIHEKLITHSFPLKEINQAIETAKDTQSSLKVLISLK